MTNTNFSKQNSENGTRRKETPNNAYFTSNKKIHGKTIILKINDYVIKSLNQKCTKHNNGLPT